MSPGDHASTAGVEAYTEDHDVARGLYLTDPDGNQVEIYADTVKDWRTQRHGTIMADSPTWSLADTAETRDILYGAVTVTGWCQLRVASSFLL